MMKNMPNLKGYLNAADNILGSVGGIIVLFIVLFIITCGLGFLYLGYFLIMGSIGMSPMMASGILIGTLSVIFLFLVVIMIIKG
jgi:hypothetical protein